MSKIFKITIDGTTYDITAYVTKKSLKIDYSLFNKLEPTTNKAEFKISGECPVIEYLLATSEYVLVEILDGATYLFKGYLTNNFNINIKNTGSDNIKLSAEDFGIKKLKKSWKSTNGLYTQFIELKICDPTDITHSIVHHICGLAGVEVASNVPKITYTTTINIQDDADNTYWNILQKLLFEYKYVFYFTNDGKLNLYYFPVSEINPATVFAPNTNLVMDNSKNGFSIAKDIVAYKQIKVNYDEWETKNNVYIFRDSTNGDSNWDCMIGVASGGYYPTGADANTFVFPEYKVESGQEVINVNDATLELQADTGITSEFENLGKKGKLRIKNTGSITAYIRKLKIRANSLILKKNENKIIAGENDTPIFEYDAKYVHTKELANELANTLKDFYKYANYTYKFKSKVDVNLGSVVTLNDNMYQMVNEQVLLIAKSIDDNGIISYTAVGVNQFDIVAVNQSIISVPTAPYLEQIGNTVISNPSITIGSTEIKLGDSIDTLTGVNISGTISGNADSATKLLNARNIGISGKVFANPVPFDGTSDITLYTTSISIQSSDVSDATNYNSPNMIVKRDGSGNFSAGTITANLSGNADSATKLKNGRIIAISGKVSGTASSFDGTSNVTISATSASILSSDITDATSSNTPNTVVKRDSNGGFSTGVITTSGDVTVGGNLIVNGTTATINSTTVTLDDPTLMLGGDTAPIIDDNKDRGINFRWHDGTNPKIGFFGFDDSTGKLTFIPNSIDTSGVFSGTKGTIDANVVWTDILSTPTTIAGYGITDVGNGTLTISTSNGISGSGTFTANQQGNTSIAISSNATPSNTPSTIVMRDTSGNFSAGTITAGLIGNVTGNADSATKLKTARTINGVSFDGTANITITANTPGTLTLGTSGVGLSGSATFNGSNATFTVNSNATDANTASTIVARDSSGNFSAGNISANITGNVSGNAGTATKLQTSRTIGISGKVTGAGISFDGSSNIIIATTSANILSSEVSDATALNTANMIVKRDSSGNFSAGTITANLTGNADTATKLQNPKTIGISGKVTGAGISFDGSSNIIIATTSANILSSEVSDATALNTANMIVKRDGTGNFSAGVVTTAGLNANGDIIQSGAHGVSNNFISGSLGTGWRADYNVSVANKSYLEVDNLLVRDNLRTSIFQKDIIKATNGQFYVSDAGVIADDYVGSNIVYFDVDKSATFAVGDVIKVKDTDIAGGQLITAVQFTIASVSSASGGKQPYTVTLNSGSLSSLQKGMTAVRISGGTVLLDASTPNSPFIDALSNGTTRARFGNLAGITSSTFGTLSGYGLWSDNVYLEGGINATSGKIANWTINSSSLTSTNARLYSSGVLSLGSADGYNTANSIYLDGANSRFSLGQKLSYSGDVLTITGNGTFSGTLTSTSGNIGGWTLGTNDIYSGGLHLVSSATAANNKIYIGAGAYNSTDTALYIDGSGKLSLKNKLAFDGTNLSVNGAITTTSGNIGGWTINSSSLTSTNARLYSSGVLSLGSADGYNTANSIYLDGANSRFSLGTALTYTGNALTINGSIASNSGNIGGWNIGTNDLYSSGLHLVSSATAGSNKIYIGAGTYNSTDTALYIDGSGKLSLKNKLAFDGTNLSINGAITTTSGNIGGWTINSSSLTSTNARLYSSGVLSLGSADGYNTANSIYLDGANSKFSLGTKLSYSGDVLTITGNGTFSGSITSTSGIIGGWTLGTNDFYSSGIHLTSSATAGNNKIYIGAGTYNSTDTALYIDGSGKISLKNNLTFDGTTLSVNGAITSTSGTIGGWSLGTNDIYSGGLHLVSSATAANNKIYIGSGAYNSTDTALYIDGSGKLSLKDKLAFDGTNLSVNGAITTTSGNIGGWTINSSSLTSTNARLYSSGVLSLGSADAYNTSDSIYLDGANTRFSLGNRLTFASNALSVNGNITTTSGNIGGWTINSSSLTSTNARLYSSGVLSLGSADGYNTANSIYLDGANSRFSLGTKLSYSGDGLSINGAITTTSGNIGGWTINSSSLTSTNARLYSSGVLSLGSADAYNTTNSIYLDGANSRFSLGQKLTYSGDTLALTGNIVSTSGNIGGWTIDSNSIYSGTKETSGNYSNAGSLTIGSDGHISSNQFRIDSNGKAYFKGNIQSANYAVDSNGYPTAGFYIDALSGTVNSYGATFTNSYIKDASFSGVINSDSLTTQNSVSIPAKTWSSPIDGTAFYNYYYSLDLRELYNFAATTFGGFTITAMQRFYDGIVLYDSSGVVRVQILTGAHPIVSGTIPAISISGLVKTKGLVPKGGYLYDIGTEEAPYRQVYYGARRLTTRLSKSQTQDLWWDDLNSFWTTYNLSGYVLYAANGYATDGDMHIEAVKKSSATVFTLYGSTNSNPNASITITDGSSSNFMCSLSF